METALGTFLGLTAGWVAWAKSSSFWPEPDRAQVLTVAGCLLSLAAAMTTFAVCLAGLAGAMSADDAAAIALAGLSVMAASMLVEPLSLIRDACSEALTPIATALGVPPSERIAAPVWWWCVGFSAFVIYTTEEGRPMARGDEMLLVSLMGTMWLVPLVALVLLPGFRRGSAIFVGRLLWFFQNPPGETRRAPVGSARAAGILSLVGSLMTGIGAWILDAPPNAPTAADTEPWVWPASGLALLAVGALVTANGVRGMMRAKDQSTVAAFALVTVGAQCVSLVDDVHAVEGTVMAILVAGLAACLFVLGIVEFVLRTMELRRVPPGSRLKRWDERLRAAAAEAGTSRQPGPDVGADRQG